MEIETPWDEAQVMKEMDDLLRAVGHYFVSFSQLVFRMRYVMSWRLTYATEDKQEFAELAFASASAQQIADAFFSMCRFDGNLNDDERAVSKALSTAVNEAITSRNVFAHGDLWPELAPSELASSTAEAVLELINMYPKRRQGAFADLEQWSTGRLDERAEELWDLLEQVTEFGALAMGLPVVGRAADGAAWEIAPLRKYRVSDVYSFKPGTSGRPEKQTKGKVVRNGPKADEVAHAAPGTSVYR